MKILVTGFILLTSLSQAQLFKPNKLKRSGGMGNGGDPYAIEFKMAGQQIISILQNADIYIDPALKDINVFLLNLNVKTTTIDVVKRDQILKDQHGNVKTAVNYPKAKLIELQPIMWEQVRGNIRLKLPLVLHEYMGLSETDEGDYAAVVDAEINSYKYASLLHKAIDAFAASIIEVIDPKSAEGSKLANLAPGIKELGRVSGNNLKYFYAFADDFGLRPHQLSVFELICKDLGYHFYVDSEVNISNNLNKTIMDVNGGVTLSETNNVTKIVDSLICGK